jgi:hypothetical protein
MQCYLLFSQLLLLSLFLQLLLAPAPGLNMQHKQQNHIHSVCANIQHAATTNISQNYKSTAIYLNVHPQQASVKKSINDLVIHAVTRCDSYSELSSPIPPEKTVI